MKSGTLQDISYQNGERTPGQVLYGCSALALPLVAYLAPQAADDDSRTRSKSLLISASEDARSDARICWECNVASYEFSRVSCVE